MAKTIDVLVTGGKATAGPPLGTTLGPMGVNVKAIVDEINKKTEGLKGMQCPVKVTINDDKSFEVEVGTPPASALIKKELGLDKASGKSGLVRVGDISMDQIKKVAKAKFGSDAEPFIKRIMGTCRSMGITIEQGPLTKEEKKAVEEMKTKEAPAAPAAGAKGEKPAEKKEAPKKEEKKK